MASESFLPRDAAVATFLRLLREPAQVRNLHGTSWEDVVRVGRQSRLLAVLGERIEAASVSDGVPAVAVRHFEAEANLAAYQGQMVRFATEELGRALLPLQVPLVLLKGAAYLLQDLPLSRGRMLSDVDLMVEKVNLASAESALLGAGWHHEELHPYDEHYYRAWSHELPPLRHLAHRIEADLHYAILPPTNRVRPSTRALFAALQAIPGTHWRVLSPEDQIVHACLHLFQDSDCSDRLRDLVDLDGLLTAFSSSAGFWSRLLDRARLHGADRAVWYGLRYARLLLQTDVSGEAEVLLKTLAPPSFAIALMDRLIPDALLPDSGRAPVAPTVRLRRTALFLRSQWVRMPPWLLAWHSAHKGARAVAEWWQSGSATRAAG